MENAVKKEKKPFKGVKIWDFLNKIPAGTMFVPLVISAIITTICIHCGLGESLWSYLGNPMKDLFGSTGQMLLIGLMLFCTGTTITGRDFIEVGKRGIWIILARLIPAYIICALVFVFAGVNGFAGIDAITLVCCLTSANAALYMGIIQPYGDDSDKGTFPIMLIFSMPLVPFIFLSCFGSGEGNVLTSVLQIISLLIPFFLGVLLGNLDHKIRDVFKGGNAIILPFLGFQFGSTIDLVNAFQGDVILAALLLVVIYWAVTLIIPFIVDRFILKRPGYASVGSCSLAGVALSIPAMVATYNFGGVTGAEAAKNATAILAFVLFITNILAPFFTKWTMNNYFKHNHDDAIRVFSRSHPELLEAVYDENGNYRTHHHFHDIYSKIFHIKSHKKDASNVEEKKDVDVTKVEETKPQINVDVKQTNNDNVIHEENINLEEKGGNNDENK